MIIIYVNRHAVFAENLTKENNGNLYGKVVKWLVKFQNQS